MKIELRFTEDYAVHKKGDVRVFSHQLGNELLKLGVAVKVAEVHKRATRVEVEEVTPPQNKAQNPPQNKAQKPPQNKKGK